MGAIVLAGGDSRRMGQDKAFVDFGGRPLVKWVCDRLEQAGCGPVIVAARASMLDRLQALGLRTVADRLPGRGPLAGFHAGLEAAGDGFHVVIACDQPFFEPEALQYLLRRARREPLDAVVPEACGRLQVLQAAYHSRVASAAEQMLQAGELTVYQLLHRLRWQAVPERELRAFGDPARMFFNVNTPEDLAAARAWAAKRDAGSN